MDTFQVFSYPLTAWLCNLETGDHCWQIVSFNIVLCDIVSCLERVKENCTWELKRGVLGKVAKVYNPLGLATLLTLVGKLIYRDACQQKKAWDAELSKELVKCWEKWEMSLPKEVEVPRALIFAREPIEAIALHAFGDTSGQGVAAAVFAVVQQESGVRQGLVAAKARLAKQGLTIPRLQLVSGHMAVNLLTNVHDALSGFPIVSQHAWLDSSVALHWIKGTGEYTQFVGNRVRKIKEKEAVVRRHVPTQENPADLASRGRPVNEENVLWWEGPKWLKDPESWPTYCDYRNYRIKRRGQSYKGTLCLSCGTGRRARHPPRQVVLLANLASVYVNDAVHTQH